MSTGASLVPGSRAGVGEKVGLILAIGFVGLILILAAKLAPVPIAPPAAPAPVPAPVNPEPTPACRCSARPFRVVCPKCHAGVWVQQGVGEAGTVTGEVGDYVPAK